MKYVSTGCKRTAAVLRILLEMGATEGGGASKVLPKAGTLRVGLKSGFADSWATAKDSE